MKWWQKAAEQGHAEALFVLGNEAYKCGGTVSDCVDLPDFLARVHPEYTEASKWYRLAAERGHLKAQIKIGAMYFEGLGVPQDYVLAHMWYNLAAAQAPKGAGPFWRRGVVKAREAVAAKMTPGQIAEAQRLAREWTAEFEKRRKK